MMGESKFVTKRSAGSRPEREFICVGWSNTDENWGTPIVETNKGSSGSFVGVVLRAPAVAD